VVQDFSGTWKIAWQPSARLAILHQPDRRVPPGAPGRRTQRSHAHRAPVDDFAYESTPAERSPQREGRPDASSDWPPDARYPESKYGRGKPIRSHSRVEGQVERPLAMQLAGKLTRSPQPCEIRQEPRHPVHTSEGCEPRRSDTDEPWLIRLSLPLPSLDVVEIPWRRQHDTVREARCGENEAPARSRFRAAIRIASIRQNKNARPAARQSYRITSVRDRGWSSVGRACEGR
jgi:hypothetical protein